MAARIPRKKGQPAKSDKHSDLYTQMKIQKELFKDYNLKIKELLL